MGRVLRRRMWLGLAAGAFLTALGVPSLGHGTIEEQRARLPPAAECDDEVAAGVWRSHTFHPEFGDWTVFTLNIRRVPGQPGQLVGTISNHSWGGDRTQEEPPPCPQQTWSEWTVSMDAVGSVSADDRISFGGIGAWRLDQVICAHGPAGYNLDHFSGQIDRSILEFQSVNNDGGRDVNEPYVFRRIRCPPMQVAESPSVNPVPPAFYPSVGCSPF